MFASLTGIQGGASASPACSVKQLPRSSKHPAYRLEGYKQISHSNVSSFLCDKSDSDASTSSTATLSTHSSKFTEGTTTLHNELPSCDDTMQECTREGNDYKTAKSSGFRFSSQSRPAAQHRDSSTTEGYGTSQYQGTEVKLSDDNIMTRRKASLKISKKAASATKTPVSNPKESVVIVISSDSSSTEPLSPRSFTHFSDKVQSPPATALNAPTESEETDFPQNATSFPPEEEPKKDSIIAEGSISPGCEKYDDIQRSNTTLTYETSLSKDVVAVTDWCHQNDTHAAINSIEKVTRWLETPNSQAGQTTDSHPLPIAVCTVEPDSQTDTDFVFHDIVDITETQKNNGSSTDSSENYETALQVQAAKLAVKESKPIHLYQQSLHEAVQDTALGPLHSTKLNKQHPEDANAQVKCTSSAVSITREKTQNEGHNPTVTNKSEVVSCGATNSKLHIPANTETDNNGDTRSTCKQLQASILAFKDYVQSDASEMPHSEKEILASASMSEMSLKHIESKPGIRLKHFTIKVERVPTKAIRISSSSKSSLLSKKEDPESLSRSSSSASSTPIDLVSAKQSKVHKLAHDHSSAVSVSFPSIIHGVKDNKASLSSESSMSIDSSVLQYSEFRHSSVQSRKVYTESSSLQSDIVSDGFGQEKSRDKEQNHSHLSSVTQHSGLSHLSAQTGKASSPQPDNTAIRFGQAEPYGRMHKQKTDSQVVATNSGTSHSSHRESAANPLFRSVEKETFKKPRFPRQIQKAICVHTKPTKQCRMDDLHLEILSWEPELFLFPQEYEDGRCIRPHLQLSQEPSHVPEVFQSYDDYINVFVPLLLLELWENVSFSASKFKFLNC